MQITALDLTSPDAFLKVLKEKSTHFFDPKIYSLLDPANHAVLDKNKRWVWVDVTVPENEADSSDTGVKTQKRRYDLNRIALNIQRLIVEYAAAFETGGGVTLKSTPGTKQEERLAEAVQKLWDDNKLDYENGAISEVRKSQKECVELWYLDAKGKPRMRLHKPADGFSFYPVWDTDADLIAFGIGWEVEGEAYSEVIRLFTDQNTYRFELTGGTWVQAEEPNSENVLGKIPLVWHFQPKADYEEVQTSIERLEESQSNLADRNDKITNPTMKVKGDLVGVYEKGASMAIELEEGSDADYLSPPQTPGSIETEQSNLRQNIFTGSQTPDLSLEALKGLGGIPSGAALKRILISAYLKAGRSHRGEYGKAIQRRINILKAIAIYQDKTLAAARDMAIKPVFNEFSVDSLDDLVALAMRANGNAPVLSQKASIALTGVTDDPDAMLAEIREEQKISGNIQTANADDQPAI